MLKLYTTNHVNQIFINRNKNNYPHGCADQDLILNLTLQIFETI